ncbi:hypothetical protein ACH47B_26525 [Rhodococcus sp. NPDC019627]|uniref:hypothetical protein n=1 Tax=unclassified Rhodococcus (in: high G+C Gram-positive bacteria) TaxID=192944 RepID=UPI0037893514
MLRSIGYRSAPIPGVPFDTVTARVPNDHGRILDHDQHGRPVPASYVTGWLKRGPRGVIGTNRGCAEQTVAQLWEDFDAGLLDRDLADRDALPQLLSRRGVEAVDWQGWQAINTAEQKRGAETARPRIKYVHLAEALAAARI